MEKLRTTLNRVLELLAGLSMAVMVILTTYQVIVRYIFSSPSTWSEELVGYIFGWSTMLGATLISGERGHMNIPVLVDRMSPPIRKAFHILWEVVAFIFSASILVFGGFQVSRLAMGQQTSSLGVAVGVFYWVMPVCGVVILLYSILNIVDIARGTIALDTSDEVSEAVAKAEADQTAEKEGLTVAIQALLVILAVLLTLLFLGVPISYAIAVSSLTAILSSIDLNVAVLTAAQRTFVGMSKFSLTAIPFFILAGNIMNQGGIAKRLVDFVMSILGKLPGALLITNIGTNALFGAISGSASAAAAAVGSMIRDGAEEQGYDPAVTAATNSASACSGLLIPPSNALITYSLASGGTSVAALFMAGYLPGIIWALCCCVVGVLLARHLGYKGTPGKFDWKNLGRCTLRALPSLSLIIVVIGGIVGGVFSATEGSAIAVVYSLVLAFCYRSINLKSLWKIIVDSAKMSGMVVFLVGVSNILGWVMAFLQIPDAVAAALLSLTSNKYVILLIMNVILLVAGTFMDVTPAILIFTPLFLPICQSFGMTSIQFGLILVYNLCIGNITPPVGNALFVGIKVGRTTLAKVMPYMLMYYAAIICGLLLVTYVPAISLALPQMTGLA